MGSSPTLDQDRGSRWREDAAGQTRQQVAEAAFDRLNPESGVPADHHDSAGHRAAQERETGLSLGARILTIPGKDYRTADAACTAAVTWPGSGRKDRSGSAPNAGPASHPSLTDWQHHKEHADGE